MKVRIIAAITAALLLALSIGYLAEAGQNGRTIKASGILEEEKIVVSVPVQLAMLGANPTQGGITQNPNSPNKPKILKPIGSVTSLNVQAGDLVKPGDLLLTADTALAEANLKRAQAQYDFIQATIDSLGDNRSTLADNREKLNATEAELLAKRAQAVRDFNANYTSGQAKISQMKQQLALLKASNASQAAIAQLEMGIAQASARLAAGKSQFSQALSKIDQGLAQISNGKKKIDEGLSTISRTGRLLEKKRSQAQIGVDIAKQILDTAKIHAKASGRIAALKVNDGSVLYPGQELMSIVRDDLLKLDLYIPLKDIRLVKNGKSVDVSVDAAPRRVFKGKIIGIGGKAIFAPSNITTGDLELIRVVQLTVEVKNKDGILKAGMPADASIN
jgi:multidrug resistance efflux pump